MLFFDVLVGIIDKIFYVIWHWPLKLLIAITGKRNYFFARMLACICAFIFAFTSVACLPFSPIFSGLSISLLVLSLIVGFVSYPRLEAQQAANPEYLIAPGLTEVLTRSYISFLSILLLFLAPANNEYLPTPLGISFALANWTFAGGMYWVRDIQPPSKSVWRRAVDWLKAHRPSWTPTLTPSPIPS